MSETLVGGDTMPVSSDGRTYSSTRLRRARLLLFAALTAGLLVMGILQVADWAKRMAVTELREGAHAALLLQSAALRSELERHRSVPLALATDPDIAELLRHPRDAAKVYLVNRKLSELSDAVGTAVLYVMDHDGLTLAASNWESDASFVGHNFSFRPYFQKALLYGSGNCTDQTATCLRSQTTAEVLAGAGTVNTAGAAYKPLADDPSPFEAYSAMLGDFAFACSAKRSNQLLAQFVPTYAYEFGDENAGPLGATHGAEIKYLFNLGGVGSGADGGPSTLPPASQQLALAMRQYWTTFAASGNPNEIIVPPWLPASSFLDSVQLLTPPLPHFDTTFGYGTRHKCSFWL